MVETGSGPIRTEADARPFSELLAELDRVQSGLEAALDQATEADLDAIVENDRGTKSAFEPIQVFLWHETYDLGQLELVRAFIDSRP